MLAEAAVPPPVGPARTGAGPAPDLSRVDRAIFDLIPDAVLILETGGEGRILRANAAAARLFGWPAGGLAGLTPDAVMDTKDPEVIRLLQEGVRSEIAVAEVVCKRKDGVQFPAEASSSLFAGPAGRLQVVLFIRDLRDRRAMEAARREKERVHRLLFGAMPGGFVLTKVVADEAGEPLDFRVLEVNPAFIELAGQPGPAAVGRMLRELPLDFGDDLMESLREVARTGRTLDFEVCERTRRRWFEVFAFRPEPGRVGYILVDITGRKASESELIEAKDDLERRVEERSSSLRSVSAILDTVMQVIPVAIVVTDERGRIRLVNREFERLFGWSSAELGGRDIFPLLFPDPEVRRQVLKDSTALRPQEWRESEVASRGGDRIPMSWAYITLPDVCIGIGLDLRRQKEAEAALQRRSEQDRQMQKMEALGTLAGGIAHDLNNMLMPISMNAELALLEIPETGPAPAYLRTILHAVARARGLVRQILTFSAVRPQERRPVRLDALVRESLKLLRSSLPATIEIRHRFAPESGVIVADPTEINQILMNLGANAGRAMRDKGGVLEVAVEPVDLDEAGARRHPDLRPGPYLRLAFRDTGVGMTPEIQARMFDPFFTTKPPGEGAGMGLAVVHGIVRSLNGAILGSSTVGEGTSFEIFLPRATVPVPPPEPPEPGDIAGGTERLLLVEDEADQARSVREALERFGYRVVTAADGAAALREFRGDPRGFDAVVTDQTMPGCTGLELAREILAARPGLPIILLTGYSDLVDAAKAAEQGIRGYLMKPYSIRELAESIRKALAG